MKAYQRKWKQERPAALRLYASAKARAKKKGLEFALKPEDVKVPELCPVLGVEMVEKTPTAPSLDRIDNSKGYVPGNVWVISRRANELKSNATLEELQALVRALASERSTF